MLLKVTTLIFVAIALPKPNVQALKFPAYLKACHRDDPNLGDCAKQSGRAGIPYFINGDKKYNIPNLNPMEILEMNIKQGSETIKLHVQMTNLKAYGLDKSVLQDFTVDYYNRTWTWTLLIPRMEVLSKYNVSGKFLLLPITGNGNANITFDNALFVFKTTWDLVTRDENEYIKFNKGIMKMTQDKAYIYLENLFNGDKLLGTQMNKFMNENSDLMFQEIGPAVEEAIAQVTDRILNSIASVVPNDEIFPKGSG